MAGTSGVANPDLTNGVEHVIIQGAATPPKPTRAWVQGVLNNIDYGDLVWTAHEAGDRVFFTYEYETIDAYKGDGDWHFRSREWLVAENADEDMVVRTAWLAILVGFEHEAREFFQYRGQRVMNPHSYGYRK